MLAATLTGPPPRFRIGSRVCVVGTPHQQGHHCGIIREAPRTYVYAIEFDGMPGTIHRWYIEPELRPALPPTR